MRLALPILITAVVLALGGCGGNDEDGDEQADRDARIESSAGFTGKAASTYDQSIKVCGAFPPEKVARDLGLDVDTSTSDGITSIAEEWSKAFEGELSEAAFEGCLDGLPEP